jgi:hypothetical protein
MRIADTAKPIHRLPVNFSMLATVTRKTFMLLLLECKWLMESNKADGICFRIRGVSRCPA